MKFKIMISTALMGAATGFTSGAVIFSQDFSANNTLSTYINATNPHSGQFNAIGSSGEGTVVSINAGVLTYARSGSNVGSFSRTTDFSPTPSALIYQFDLTMSGNSSATTSAAVFQIGSGYGTANAAETNANTYARLGINIGANAGEFSIRDITNLTTSSTFSGTQSFFWVLNNTGASISYTAPNSSVFSIANDTADLWLGTTRVWEGVAIQTPTQVMTDLKFAFTSGTATIGIDNMVITVIPEPTTALLGGFGLLALLRRRR